MLLSKTAFFTEHLTATYNQPTDGEVKIKPHFEERVNLLSMAYFTRSKLKK